MWREYLRHWSAPGADRSGHEDAEPARVFPSSLPAAVDVSSAEGACPHPRARMHAQVRPGALDTATLTLRAQLPMQSPAVSRSRHLTVCDGVSLCASVIVQNIRCFGYRNLTLGTYVF